MMQLSEAKNFIIEKLKKELPGHLSYHNVAHTEDVYGACKQIALSENIQGEDLELLLTAAAFHDSGFIVRAEGHELISCEIARENLPRYGYSAAQMDRVCGMIMATKIPQMPQNHIENVMSDADLDYLGRDDFSEISNKLFLELVATEKIKDEDAWNRLQVKFFDSHHYFTETSKQNRNKKKQQNLDLVKSKIEGAI